MLKGYIGNTDFDWFAFLSRQPDPEEVNFWRPSGRAFRAPVGTPFFFRLKSPRNVIAGFGCFARHETLPLSMAWEWFGERNGAPDLVALRQLIQRHRAPAPDARFEDFLIGCTMITSPVFFAREDWIPQPVDWPRTVVPGMSYDLTSPEGRRIWDACVALVNGRDAVAPSKEQPLGDLRFGSPQLIRPRLGQGTFRAFVEAAYDHACAVTTEHSRPVLEAAHIRPYAAGGLHEVSNGILLRSDIHRLFDQGFVTVTPEYRFEVSPQLRKRWGNGRSYDDLRHRPIRLPEASGDRPDPGLLAWHNESVFMS